MSKVATNKLIKNNMLFQTAFELFREKGFAKTTISDIVKRAGLAKGTFYLYFKDKYDLRDRLVIHKTGQLFSGAHNELLAQKLTDFNEIILFVVDYFVRVLSKDPGLLKFISKNLSWGIFMTTLQKNIPEESRDFYEYYMERMRICHLSCEYPDLMLFTILELVRSTCYSGILYHEPVSMEEYLPHLKQIVLMIVDNYTTVNDPE